VRFHSNWDAPEIDGSVMVGESIPVGEFADITIGDWRGDSAETLTIPQDSVRRGGWLNEAFASFRPKRNPR
jgi:hypothetical protein